VSIVVDIQTISIMLASASVIAGVVYYALQIRHQTKMRQTDVITRLYSIAISKEWVEAWVKFEDREITDFRTYKKEYGFVELNQVVNYFEELGMLLHRKLLDAGLIDDLWHGQVQVVWKKLEPMVKEARKEWNLPRLCAMTEYPYNEMKKREQRQ